MANAGRKFCPNLLILFIFFCGQTLGVTPPRQVEGRGSSFKAEQRFLGATENVIHPMWAAPPPGSTLLRDSWSARCDSETTGGECSNAIGGSKKKFWRTPIDNAVHTITINLNAVEHVCGLQMIPALNDRITQHKVYVSNDSATLGELVAYGTWHDDDQEKFAIFETRRIQYVHLQAVQDPAADASSISVSDIFIWSNETYTEPPHALGRWGPTINFPIVPVAAWVHPPSGNVITFSSYSHDGFSQTESTGVTLTATLDRRMQSVSQRQVDETKHDMFCPGMSFHVDGSVVITGGSTAEKVSIYNETTGRWKAATPMNIPRGYQGQVTCADGRIIVVGGSWGPLPEQLPYGNRTGEIYDPGKDNWTMLEGCPAQPLQTTHDWEGEYRADNHMWLMGWKDGYVFQAGPALEMHWINTAGTGTLQSAGMRGTSSLMDDDAMCGIAAMFDATHGLILTAGGAKSYKYLDNSYPPKVRGTPATDNSFLIKLGEVGAPVNVTLAGGGHMRYKRIFHNAVILPNGEVLVLGGQELGQPFNDSTPIFAPELYTPGEDGGTWTTMASNSIVRAYHSFALLLPDASVLLGGGGLCSGCEVNRFDAQIYTPPYLLTGVQRPAITRLPSPSALRPGASFTFSTDREISTASLIRYSSVTHSLNTDQRRIPLTMTTTGVDFEYRVIIPSDGGIVIPGYWMLFAIDAEGVPSVAENVRVLVE